MNKTGRVLLESWCLVDDYQTWLKIIGGNDELCRLGGGGGEEGLLQSRCEPTQPPGGNSRLGKA